MEIRKSQLEDFDAIMRIYAHARQFMAEHGNPRQWGATNWPPAPLIQNDIAVGKSYVCLDKEKILAVFFYDFGNDVEPTYHVIQKGDWEDRTPYGVIHRLAVTEGARGVGSFCLNWALAQSGHLRVDTHTDNVVMQNLLIKLGFSYRGIIYVKEDDDPRLAYEKSGAMHMTLRRATVDDLEAIADVERECFPVAEAATRAEFADRLAYYAEHFWLMFDREKLIAFIDGFATDEPDLTDEMYANASLHDESGAWQMIFGVNTIPTYRKHGYAGQLIGQMVADAKAQKRKGLVLTCKDELVRYYAQFGFVSEGKSKKSRHGGVEWNQMRLTFDL